PESIWHTKHDLSDKLPQSIPLEFESAYRLDKLTYLPRPTGPNGIITAYNLYASDDGKVFDRIAFGEWENDPAEKTVAFKSVKTRFIRLEATAGHGGWASAAEIRVYKAK
ncbi:MAG: discoidin domain-containing protein, partial [Verrucomicrobia bacterium]|nr:discoidin domain-containing protein [Verrucomicrobiota bacterium]